MLLARRGYRVLAVDRSAFPSDRLSTHYIHQDGLARLQDWGLLGKLQATGCPPITHAEWFFGDIAIRGFSPPVGGVREAYAPRRTVLDAMLVDAAREAGADVRERFAVHGLMMEDGRVAGIRGRAHGGRECVERARLVIGADGRRSLVARAAAARSYDVRAPQTCVYYSYWTGIARGYQMYLDDRQQVGLWPTHDDAVILSAILPYDQFSRFRRDVEGTLLGIVASLCPDLAEEIASGGRREERFYGTAQVPSYYREAHGPGWALAGDAGHHKDSITGRGISDSFRDAQLLAEAVDVGLSGGGPLSEALAAYQRARDLATGGLYDLTWAAAELELNPELREMISALQVSREHTDQFFGVLSSAVGVEEFFAPENMESLSEAASAGVSPVMDATATP
jgi:flavin-dependent dehydrogenase